MQQGSYQTRQVNLASGTFTMICRIRRKVCEGCKQRGRIRYITELLEARNITCDQTSSPVGDSFPIGKRVIHALRLTPEFDQTSCHAVSNKKKRSLVAV